MSNGAVIRITGTLKENGDWDRLWNAMEKDIADGFMTGADPMVYHQRLISMRELKQFMESQ